MLLQGKNYQLIYFVSMLNRYLIPEMGTRKFRIKETLFFEAGKVFSNHKSNIKNLWYLCSISKGVPQAAEIIPIEPEQVMLLREGRSVKKLYLF